MLIVVSNTKGRLIIIPSNVSYKNNVFFPHVRSFTLIYGPYSCLIDVLFDPILMEFFFSCFFKCSLNFKAHALQFDFNKVGYTSFAKFRLQSMSSKIERAFEKTNIPCFYLHLKKSKSKLFVQPFLLKFSYIFTILM